MEEKESNSKRMKISESTEKRENENGEYYIFIFKMMKLIIIEASHQNYICMYNLISEILFPFLSYI